MSDVVIHSEGLGKSYFIGHQGPRERYTALRDVIARQARDIWESTRRAWRGQAVIAGEEIEEFWALRDVSFEVKRGEVVGIIGRNGAGKSTLLKILSRITEPTEGRVTLRGRVASLLEVGTGFHPELTGRENIYLNGAILGMPRAEIKRKFDEIVAFAEVEKFLDTPVKRFSSGMYVRLAFAVAAHLEPEIMLVDEVLAVGDAAFQKKCLGKMKNVAQGGRTVLFVSHNMAAVENLCNSCTCLRNGRIERNGATAEVVAAYLSEFGATRTSSCDLTSLGNGRRGSGEVRIEHAELFNLDGDSSCTFPMGCGFRIRVRMRSKSRLTRVSVAVAIFDRHAMRISVVHSGDTTRATFDVRPIDASQVECVIPEMNLMPGDYRLNIGVQRSDSRELLDFVDGALEFQVVPSDVYGTGRLPHQQATIFLPVSWSAQNGHSRADFGQDAAQDSLPSNAPGQGNIDESGAHSRGGAARHQEHKWC